MSYPNIQYLKPGDEKKTTTQKNEGMKLGGKGILPDGREFRYCRASATALVAGKLYQQAGGLLAGDADYAAILAVAAAAASGQCTVTVTLGATTACGTVNLFADGYMAVASSAGSGNGYVYAIKSCNTAAAGSTLTLTLEPTDPLKVALVAGTNTVGLRENPYAALTLTTADTIGLGKLAGVTPAAIAASKYGWIQTKGAVMCLGDGTLIVGEPVCVSNVAGAVEVIPPAAADTIGTRVVKQMVKIGYCMNVAASAAYSLIDLQLD